jgi:acyl-CoA synthetase (NDP forming)
VAVVGATPEYGKRGGRILGYLERYFRGSIYRVNPNYSAIRDQPCYASISDVPGTIDVAILCIRAEFVPEIVRECGRCGVGAAMVIAAGFAESGVEGQHLNADLIAAREESGIRILGPNTAGYRVMLSPDDALFATHAADPARGYAYGPAAMITQSGGLGIYLGAVQLAQSGVGSRYLIDTGNELDVDIAESLAFIAGDPEVKCIGIAAEGTRDGRQLCEAMRYARAEGKAVVVLKLARNALGARFAQSHTGVLAGRAQLFESELREAGACVARNEQDMIDAMLLHCTDRAPAGRRLGVVATSGGMCVLMLDLAAESGLSVPIPEVPPGPEVLGALPFSHADNPLDIAGYMTAGPLALEHCLSYMSSQPNLDAVVLCQGEMGGAEFSTVERAVNATTKPIFYLGAHNPTYAKKLFDIGVLQFTMPSRFTAALRTATDGLPVGALASPLAHHRGDVLTATARFVRLLPEYAALMTVRSWPITSAADAVQRQEHEGAPIVLKVESDLIAHKSELQLVSPPVSGADVEPAYDRLLQARGRSPDPAAQVVAQPYVSGFELAIGAYRDPAFGPTVMVATGGIYLEVLDDAVFAVAPVDEERATQMLRKLRGYPLLNGARGRAVRDVPAAARAIAALSRVIAEHDDFESIDLNPVIVLKDGEGAVLVDALALPRRS